MYREMPPDEPRETPIVEDQSAACHDRAVMANPLRRGHEDIPAPAPVPAPVPGPELEELSEPAIEFIPPPPPQGSG